MSASATNCVVEGEGLQFATVRQTSSFKIVAHDGEGKPLDKGGDAFFVAIRGASRVRARVIDNQDGSYAVEYRPSVSGSYTISVSAFGMSLPGSPWQLDVHTLAPTAARCELSGAALTRATARQTHQFEVRFKSADGQVAHAEDLDVFVEPIELEALQVEAPTIDATEVDDSAAAEGAAPDSPSSPGPTKGLSAAAQQQSEAPPPNVERETLEDMFFPSAGRPSYGEPQTPAASSTARAPKFHRRRVAVGDKPLIVREGTALDSELVGQLVPGQHVQVVKARELPDGSVRALVQLVDEFEATRKVLTSWWQPPGEQVAEQLESGELSFEMLMLDSARSISLSPGRASPKGSLSPERDWNSNPFMAGYVDLVSDNNRSARSASPPLKKKRGIVGWVTVVKGGDDLVHDRERLDAGQRQRHLQQWQRRQRIDKSVAASAAFNKQNDRHVRRAGSKHAKDSDARDVRKARSPYQQELSSDPSGIGFAFGGVEPGLLHAKGQLHEVHKVFYSVGRVGKYKLHVALRREAIPLPGSPFELEVSPGPAHADSTRLNLESGTLLRGTVGMTASNGVPITFTTCDKMGNVCRAGGANVSGGSAGHGGDAIECEKTDNNDGTYMLKWRSKFSGVFEVHVLIDQADVIGSPFSLRLVSTVPDLTKAKATMPDSKSVVAGSAVSIPIKFVDQYDNVATPGPSYHFALAIVPEKSNEKIATVKPIDHTGGFSSTEEGQYDMTFTPTQAGISSLHLWCCEGDKADAVRNPLPGSPFQVLVQAGAADAAASEVEGYQIEAKAVPAAEKLQNSKKQQSRANLLVAPQPDQVGLAQIVAGDAIFVRPQLRDTYGNPATVPEESLNVELEMPDGSFRTMRTVGHVRGGLTSYEIRHETDLSGTHLMHVRLYGVEIKGSPVEFQVSPATHEASNTVQDTGKLPEVFHPDADPAYSFLVKLRDRFGNFVTTGGAALQAKLNYVKQGMHDSNALKADNHIISTDDLNNGSYKVTFGVSAKGLNFASPITVQVIVNIDRDPKEKPNGIDLPATSCVFVQSTPTEVPKEKEKDSSGPSRKEKDAKRKSSVSKEGPPLPRKQSPSPTHDEAADDEEKPAEGPVDAFNSRGSIDAFSSTGSKIDAFSSTGSKKSNVEAHSSTGSKKSTRS